MGTMASGFRQWWGRNRTTSLRLGVGAVIAWVGFWALEALVYGHQGPWIVFYGRVIDRGGRPVEGQVVTVEVYQRTCAPIGMGRTVDIVTLTPTTDADGRFEVRGMRGVWLGVCSLWRDHYVLDDPRASRWRFFYDAKYRRDVCEPGPVYEPDARRPAVFVVDRGR